MKKTILLTILFLFSVTSFSAKGKPSTSPRISMNKQGCGQIPFISGAKQELPKSRGSRAILKPYNGSNSGPKNIVDDVFVSDFMFSANFSIDMAMFNELNELEKTRANKLNDLLNKGVPFNTREHFVSLSKEDDGTYNLSFRVSYYSDKDGFITMIDEKYINGKIISDNDKIKEVSFNDGKVIASSVFLGCTLNIDFKPLLYGLFSQLSFKITAPTD